MSGGYDSIQLPDDGPLHLTKQEVLERRGVDKELSSIDERLIRYAGVKTPEEISEITGIPALDVVRRIHEVLNSVDILTIEQKRAKMVLTLETMVAEAVSRISSATDRNIGALLNSTGGNVTRVLNELEAMETRTKMDIEAINKRRAHELVTIVERSFDRSLGELSARYPDVDQDEIQAVFRAHLMTVANEYDEA